MSAEQEEALFIQRGSDAAGELADAMSDTILEFFGNNPDDENPFVQNAVVIAATLLLVRAVSNALPPVQRARFNSLLSACLAEGASGVGGPESLQ
jgi:hypothetical protein